MRNNGLKPDRIVIAVGATRSPLWLKIHADVSNLPLTITKEVSDAPSLGCAILAATRAGLFPDVSTAVEKMVQVDRLVEPNSEVHQQYQPFYENYKETYHSMKKLRMGLE